MGESNLTPSKKLNVWRDQEGDFLEVSWGISVDVSETQDDRAMVNLDKDGNIVGFSILGMSDAQKSLLNLNLTPLPDETFEVVGEE